MPTGPYEVTLKFNFAGNGWSESWFYNSLNPFSDADQKVCEKMANSRLGLVGLGVALEEISVGDLSNPRAVLPFPLLKTTGQIDDTPDQGAASWLLRAMGPGGFGARQVWCRNIPDGFVVWDSAQNKFAPTGDFLTAFNRFKTEIVKAPWSLRTRRKRNAVGTATAIVTKIEVSAGGLATLTLKAAPGWADSDSIIIDGFKKPISTINGVYAPGNWSLSGLVLTLSKPLSFFDALTYKTGGFGRKMVYDMTPVANLIFRRPGTRRVGAPLGRPAGRR